MKTTLAVWLENRGETPRGLAARLGMHAHSIYALCGIRAAKAPGFFRTSTLERISVETGIPWHQLHDDWTKVEPMPAGPRGRPRGRKKGDLYT